ncbi:MAG: hypothetical protein JW986_03920 [Methanotrichaceae archaeon]|nr:hypothetical protein [Methanotrichaceae archaeon]
MTGISKARQRVATRAWIWAVLAGAIILFQGAYADVILPSLSDASPVNSKLEIVLGRDLVKIDVLEDDGALLSRASAEIDIRAIAEAYSPGPLVKPQPLDVIFLVPEGAEKIDVSADGQGLEFSYLENASEFIEENVAYASYYEEYQAIRFQVPWARSSSWLQDHHEMSTKILVAYDCIPEATAAGYMLRYGLIPLAYEEIRVDIRLPATAEVLDTHPEMAISRNESGVYLELLDMERYGVRDPLTDVEVGFSIR